MGFLSARRKAVEEEKKKKEKEKREFLHGTPKCSRFERGLRGNTFNLSLIYSRKGKNKKYPEKQKNTKKERESEREKKEIEYNEEVEGRERC